MHETEFGGVYIDKTIEEFNALGFAYGDKLTVAFSNGYTLIDIPYYNGYYSENGAPLLVAFPDYPHIEAAINNGNSLWAVAGLQEGDTATITRSEAGVFLAVQNARDIHYTDNRSDYESDEIFANFRSVKVTGIRENSLYRSASPCDNRHNRAPFVDKLIAEAGVRFVLDLADNEEKIRGYLADPDFNSPYFRTLLDQGLVLPIGLNMNYSSQEFKEKVALGLAALAEHERPCLVHCTKGKDRTGFVCMLLEALCGASYDEIVNDYMLTYRNYYRITQDNEKEKYDTLVDSLLDPMVRSLTDGETTDLRSLDLSQCAKDYLLSGGMSEAQMEALITKF